MGILGIFKTKNNNMPLTENKVVPETKEEDNYIDYEVLNGGVDVDFSLEEKKALFLNSFKKASPGKSLEEYPSYFVYNYKIIDPAQFHKELIDDGYFEPANFSSILDTLNVKELKEIIEFYNIDSKKNNRKVMCENIMLQLSENTKKEIENNNDSYMLSEKAHLFMEEYKDLLTLIENPSWRISYTLYKKYKNEYPPYLKFRDIVWRIFNDRLNLAMLQKKYNILFYTYKNKAQFLKDENKYQESLKNYLLCLFLELNYYQFQDLLEQEIEHPDSYSKDYLISILNNRNINSISQDIIMEIKRLKEYYDENVLQKVLDTKPELNYFISDEDFTSFINDIYTKPVIDMEMYINKIIYNANKIINAL